MKLRVSLQLIAALALLAGLTIPAAAQAGTAKHPGHHGKSGAGKRCPAKKNGKGKRKGKCAGKKAPGGPVGSAGGACASDAQECYVDFEVRQASPLTGGFCDSFDRGEGTCIGPSVGTGGWTVASYAPKYGLQTWFTWTSQGSVRNVDYTAKASFTILEAFIRGNVPAPDSAVFNVTDAYSRSSGRHWKTVASGGAPGTRGGPLYIDYEHRAITSSIHIWGYLVPASSAAASTSAAKPRSYECQHPVVTGQEAVNPKGVSPKQACRVVRSLGRFLSKPANMKKLYECRGETPRRPGRPVLLMDEFQGWKLKLVNGYSFVMHKPGASFRVTGTDFPVNCS